jgi:serine/threonine protein kinase
MVAASHAPTAPVEVVAPQPLEVGQALPGTDYLLTSRIAQRTAADVFGSQDPESGRPLAIKVLRPDAIDLSRRCFIEEIRLTRRIDSPRVVEVVDAAWTPDGLPWYAMTRPTMLSLRDVVRAGIRLSVARCLGILRSAALAVGDAHAAGIVHRDVKPSNLLIVSDEDGRERVVLIDFGIACEVGVRPMHHSGTPRYMPPEQAEDTPAIEATDVYALGCIAYEMLNGRGLTDAKTMDGVRKPGEAPLVPEWYGRTPTWLRRVILRCIHPLPHLRYAATLDLFRALGGRAVAA